MYKSDCDALATKAKLGEKKFMQKYLKCLDSSPENGTFDILCTSDHGNISFQLGNIFYGF